MTPKGPMPPHNMKKFMFDVHNFDEREEDVLEEEEEILPPPPPSFSEEELEEARQAAYNQGKSDGLAEALNSFEMQVTDTLAIIRDHFSILFDAEDRRNRVFEKEAVQLSQAIFARSFPYMNEQFGMENVKQAIANILETVREQPELVIDVPPAYVETIQTHIDGLLRLQDGPRCTVRANDTLAQGQCRIVWNNGSAIRNPDALAEQIHARIEHLLADKAKLADNESAEAQPPSGPAESGIESGIENGEP